MGLLSKLKSNASGAARAGASPADANEIVRDARTKARRRLIGAALLLGVGIIGFPLLFETQPRPIAIDIPIEIPSRDSVSPLQAPASRPARNPGGVAVAAKPPVEAPPAAEPVASAEPKPAPAAPPAKAEATPEAKPDPKPAAAKPVAEAAKPAEPAKPNDSAADSGRYVVQIGAFAEAAGAREARMKVEGMGLKTYTQVIESASGRRIRVRVGPYATKAEAEKAAARIKAGGLQAAVLVL